MTFAASPARHAARLHRLLPHWLVHLGALGLFAVAALDASVIPLPIPGSTDLLLLFLAAHRDNPWLLVISAVGGCLIGAYLTWATGRKGGEAMLRRRLSPKPWP